MDLIRHIDQQPAKQAIVRHLVRLCEEMRIEVIAEGIETLAERDFLRHAGVELMQGYLFARPAFKALAPINAAALIK
jgi:EAL domain-containing protein (putative c-di-GMP-specific phosphodiesterase class I)